MPLFVIPFPAVDPVAIWIGPFAIRWYALAYIVGLLIGWRYCLRLAERPPRLVARQDVDDFLVWATLGVVLGGRIGYVLFYKPGYYIYHPFEALYVWHGGMSFHGGALGVTIAIMLFTRARGIPLFAFSDIITEAIPIGLFFGRIANFINGELYGRPSNLPWAMIFPNGGPVPRHPSQLYEAFCEGILLFILLFAAERLHARERPAVVTGLFLVGYAAARMSGELFREPDPQLGFLIFGTTMGQLLSIPLLIAGVLIIAWGAARARSGPVVSGEIADKIARRIRAEGPLTVAAYMAMALHDPEGGYYARRGPIGAAGDFTTAPEISQIFGELIGLWCAELWERIGRPDPVILAELGPGRGVLMSDLLRAAGTVPEFRRALRICLVEASPMLRAEQERRLRQAQPAWVSRVEELPDGPMLLVANEFLDALPIRQFVRGAGGWSERMVAMDPGDRLVFVDGPQSPLASLLVSGGPSHCAPGTIAEICPAALALAGALGSRLARQPGAALFIDYGYFPTAPGPTLRALQGHRPVSALAAPGTADLSAHVDFAAFAEAAQAAGVKVYGPISQGRFLTTLGAGLRLAALSARVAPAQRRSLKSSVKRLLARDEMGELFKVVALVSPDLPSPAGFDPSVDTNEPAQQ